MEIGGKGIPSVDHRQIGKVFRGLLRIDDIVEIGFRFGNAIQ